VIRRPRAIRLAALILLAAGAPLVSPPAARADGLADEAELHFQRGADLYRKGDFSEALEHLMLSNRLVPNRNVVYNIARTFEQMKRFSDAHRYYVDALAGETDSKAIQEVSAAIARIAPEVAVLRVVTSPPGATIYIDRKDLGSRGRSPRPLALPPGRYKVLAELDGYDPRTAEAVETKLGKETVVTIELVKITGTVHVEVEDGGHAAVHVDDPAAPPACDAPCDLPLGPGRHDLHLSREGFQTALLPVIVTPRKSISARAALAPLTGSLLVSTEERGALVTVDGKPAGFTPTVIQGVSAGRRKVVVSLRGYAPFETSAEVKVGQQASLENLELKPLREVTAVSRYAEKIDDAPSSVSIIDAQELRAFGYPTIAESLRGLRGVTLSNDRVYASAGIRALGQPNDYGNRLLVLSDGQALNDNLLNSSYIGSDGRVDLHDVDRIEVVRGPGSLLYGTGAFSGVINLVTRPRDEPNGVHLGVGVYDDTALHARAGFHYNYSPNAGIWASASAAHSEGIDVNVPLKAPDGPPSQLAHGVDAFSSGGTAGRFWWGPVTGQWFYHQREQVAPVGAYSTNVGDSRSRYTDTRMMAEIRFEPHLSNSVQLMTRVHANRYTYLGLNQFTESNNIEHFYGTWFGGEARIIYSPSARLRITAGGEGQLHPEATLLGETHSGAVVTPYLNEHDPYRFGAGYAIVEGSPFPWLRASAGARVDVYSTFGPIVVPRAALIFHTSQNGVLKVMGGRAFRAPSIYEQAYNDNGYSEVRGVQPARGITVGPESIYSSEIEYSHRFLEDWVALGAAHASYLTGLIDTIPDTPGSALVRYANSPTPSATVGGDVEIRREWRKGWMLSAMYGYQWSHFLDASLANKQFVNAPSHLASLRGVVPVVRDLCSLGLRTRLEAPRRISVETADAMTRGAAILDATVSGNLRDYGLRYVFGVYNITDQRYEVPVTDNFQSRTMPQNGRTFLLDLLWTYP
jgi:outer membrane receptor for ferrienterochelin and colicins